MVITASAPGKVILFGEHAVVYGKLGIAAAIGLRAQSSVERAKSIAVENIGKFMLSLDQLEEINLTVNSLVSKNDFSSIKAMLDDDANICTKYMISEIAKLTELQPFKMKNKSQLRKGMGGSAAIFSSEARALSELFGLGLAKKKISEFAYKGDIIAHGGTPSGIDNSTVTFGGYVSFMKSRGPEILDIDAKLPIVIGDTKKPASTAQTVSMVRSHVEKGNQKFIRAIDAIEEISAAGIDAIKSGNLVNVGKLMDRNQEKLRVLGVSSIELEHLIAAAKRAGAYGAKLSGGGGGGIMIALCDEGNQKHVAKAINDAGGDAIITEVGAEGVRVEK